jgi:hypothetical protein
MNKDTLSWIHYFYATVTASVLAYVTSMDMGDKNDNDESSAIDMLPDFGSNEETEVYEEPQEQEVFEEAEVYEEPQEQEEPVEPSNTMEPPVAQPINTFSSSNGGKLKKNKTKNKKNKNNKTRNRK